MLCFSMICGSAGSKSNLAKAAGAEVAFQLGNEKLHAAVARSTFSIKMHLSLHVRTTFRSCDVEKLHAAVARSTFQSQNVQNTAFSDHFLKLQCGKIAAAVARSTFASQNVKKLTGSDHFLKLRCGKIARRCSEKHICKSKCAKHHMLGPLFEVQMWKNCTPL